MSRPRLLDLFCGAGGAAVGYHRAGFDVVGVDIVAQPRYPFEFHLSDALLFLEKEWLVERFDAIHASPPCQDHSVTRSKHDGHGTGWILAATIERLEQIGMPFVVENVAGSGDELGGHWTVLCGSSFGLGVRRHRLFRSNMLILAPPCAHHLQPHPVGVYGGPQSRTNLNRRLPGEPLTTADDDREAMGIPWMTRKELAQAIPPAYTEYIGQQLIAYVTCS